MVDPVFGGSYSKNFADASENPNSAKFWYLLLAGNAASDGAICLAPTLDISKGMEAPQYVKPPFML